jgi:hypothetical protein
MALTEEHILDVRDEIHSRLKTNDELFDKLMKKISSKDKAKFDNLEDEFLDFCFNNIYYKPKDVRRFIRSLYEREILKPIDDEEL